MRKLIKFINCLASIILFSNGVVVAHAEMLLSKNYINSANLSEEGIKTAHSVTVANDQFYAYLDDESIRIVREDYQTDLVCKLPTIQPGVISAFSEEELDEIVTHVATDGVNLYGWDIYTGCFGLIDEAGIHWQQTHLPVDELHPWNDENTLRVVRNYVDDGKLYVFASLTEYQDKPGLLLIQFDLYHGFAKTVEISDAISACRGNDSKYYSLCVEDKNGWSIKEINTKTMEQAPVTVDLSAYGEDDVLCGFAFSGEDNSFLFAYNGSVYSFGRNKKPEIVGAINTGNCMYDCEAWFLSDGRYALSSLNGIYIVDLNKPEENNSRLVTQGLCPLKIEDMFRNRFPQTILVSDHKEISAEQVMTKLLTRDPSTDVFLIRVDSNYNTLRKNGFLKPIDFFAGTQKYSAGLSANIVDAITDQNGNMVAYPAHLSIRICSIHPGYWQLVFGDLPFPSTVGELLDYWILFEEEFANEYPLLDMWNGFDEYTIMKELVLNYLQTHDHPANAIASGNALKDALEKMQRIVKIREDHHRTMTKWEPEDEEGHGFILSLFGEQEAMRNSNQGIYLETQENLVYGIPIFEETAVSLIWGDGDTEETNLDMSVYVVNPYSEHIEEVVKYLECATEQEANPYLYYAIHPEQNEPLEYEDIEERIADAEKEIEMLEKLLLNDDLEPENRFDLEAMLTYNQRMLQNIDQVKWRISDETIADNRRLLQNINLHMDNVCLTAMMNSDTIDQLCQQYIQGNMTTEAFLKILSDKLTMIEKENQ